MSTLVLAIIVVIILSLAHWYRRNAFLPPGPRGIPFFGVLPFFGKSPPLKYEDWRKLYGNIFTIRAGEHDFVVLADYDLIYELNVKQGARVIHRPHLFIFDVCARGLGIIFGQEAVWQPMRNFVATSFRRFAGSMKIVENAIHNECDFVLKAFQEKENKAFNPKDILYLAATNVSLVTLFSQRFDYDDPELRELCHRLVRGLQDHGLEVQLLAFCSKMRFIPKFAKTLENFQIDYQYIVDSATKFYREHLATYDGNEIRDLVDAFIAETKTEGHNKHFAEEELGYVIKDLLDGGSQTTITVMLWSIISLILYPEYQERIKNEVESVVGEGKQLTIAHRENMHLTLAFITEVMRKCTVLAASAVQTSESVELAGFKLPKGTPILSLIWTVHHNPDYFKDPEVFRPERHLDGNGVYRKSKYFIPFSLGRRNCVGEHVAQQELFLFLVNIIRRYVIRKSGYVPELEKGLHGMVYVPPPFKIEITERD